MVQTEFHRIWYLQTKEMENVEEIWHYSGLRLCPSMKINMFQIVTNDVKSSVVLNFP